ncbi:AbrB/MazE/SpoVT family DNA-binding domain-containing protein [candidate division WOR-3 bacterium]|nr:AbrB/MazE/SpoVT family DNA-binding domain-containing protein [candidate division WOR-3 bacterium]
MSLIRGFSKVDEEGKIAIPSNIRKKAGVSAGSLVEIKVIRIKDSSRWPHLIVHAFRVCPRLSMFQVVMREEEIEIDDEANLILTDDLLEEAKLGPNYRVEIKLYGPNQGSWITIYNRGPNRLTTLQEKIGRMGKAEKKWKEMTIEY